MEINFEEEDCCTLDLIVNSSKEGRIVAHYTESDGARIKETIIFAVSEMNDTSTAGKALKVHTVGQTLLVKLDEFFKK